MGDNGGDNRRLFEHFIVAGLADGADELTPVIHECGNKPPEQVAPIIDITVIFPSLGETVPKGYECIETTPSGHPADLNHGSFRTNSAFLCYRRGYNKPALVDIGILDESKNEKVKFDSTIIQHTHFGHSANVNNSSTGLYFTTRRSKNNAPPHQLVITHICVILSTKGEVPPHTYFKIDKNLNKGMVGSGVYVCYKKAQSSSKRISYKPFILDCYPKVEDMTNSIAQNVSMFCLPMGAVIESWAKDCSEPEKMFSTCVLTDEVGNKFYGASLTFYEKYSKELSDAQLEKLELSSMIPEEEGGEGQDPVSTEAKYYSSKAICIVSRYPFFESFRKFLFFVNGMSQSGPHKLPIERYISHLMLEVPFPSPARPRVLVQLNTELVAFESHDDSQVPLSGATFVESLKFLGVDNILYAMLLSLLEQKILVHSLRSWLLTAVSETLCAMMFPFHWQCPYIPQCPLDLAGVLHAPLPFIAGVHSRYFDLYEDPPDDVTCFDLDTTTISNSVVRKNLKLNVLPKKPLKKLRQSLEKLYVEVQNNEKKLRGDSDYKKKLDLSIREEFLRFMCHLMMNYVDHLKPITSSPKTVNATDMNTLFDLDNFLKSRDKNSQEFYRRFSETQCFIRFIEERSFISDKNVYNVFFDDCAEKMKRDGFTGPLLDYDSYLANHTIVVPPPEMLTYKERTYDYSGFPSEFDEDLFETEAIIKKKNDAVPPARLPYSSSDPDAQPYAFIRSKQEVRIATIELKHALEQSEMNWPRSLLFYAYSLWFLQMPALVSVSRNKFKMLLLAFRILTRMEKSGVIFYDQVAYRTLIRLCGEYKYPALAYDVLKKINRHGINMNAITYGTYHWAVMQGKWPSQTQINAHAAWRRLRLRLETAASFYLPIRNGLVRPETQVEIQDDKASITSSHSRNDLRVGSSVSGSLSNQSLGTTNVLDEEKLSIQNSISPNENLMSSRKVSQEDPLGAYSNGEIKREISKGSLNETLSPSRHQFIKEHSTSPFSKEMDDLDKKLAQERKKSSKLGGSWLKGFTTSPMINKLMKTTGSDARDKQKSQSIGGNEKSESSQSSLNMSPSLHSLVTQFRKQAIKGYEQSSVMLKKSMLNSLIGDSKHHKNTSKDALSTMSSSEENLDLLDPYSKDGIYQLDSGTSGDLLSLDFWMKDALPESISRLDQLCSNTQEDPLDVVLSSASKCPTCESIIYDEELMNGWKMGSVNMNSTCPLCLTSFSPSLSIFIQERPLEKLASSWYVPFIFNFLGDEKCSTIDDHGVKDGLNLSVPFLSPIALKKEMEMLLLNDPSSFARPSLKVSHPVVFWNLLYYCRRLDLPSHIYAWLSPKVHIRCVYDIPSLHSEQLAPMYFSRDEVGSLNLT
ncbi:unnamed protein product [Bursaphelenchus xylophilus]|uniref:(pine wood nematode) hypothetical protein n=1 Tax=Bursaphelenchus xylophilus TaxID=6326 RepID=A0A1I7S348_BURXY|nr:unnamed protein product [Bursaphelenchus xylophilus]CAG9116094.1 unnamed protein product [Bursaphelenchus xylophilus]